MSHPVRLYPSSCAALQTAVFGPIIRSGCQFAVTWREEAPASYKEYTLNLRVTQELDRMRKGHTMQGVYGVFSLQTASPGGGKRGEEYQENLWQIAREQQELLIWSRV